MGMTSIPGLFAPNCMAVVAGNTNWPPWWLITCCTKNHPLTPWGSLKGLYQASKVNGGLFSTAFPFISDKLLGE
jgi:hypothetical protein